MERFCFFTRFVFADLLCLAFLTFRGGVFIKFHEICECLTSRFSEQKTITVREIIIYHNLGAQHKFSGKCIQFRSIPDKTHLPNSVYTSIWAIFSPFWRKFNNKCSRKRMTLTLENFSKILEYYRNENLMCSGPALRFPLLTLRNSPILFPNTHTISSFDFERAKLIETIRRWNASLEYSR